MEHRLGTRFPLNLHIELWRVGQLNGKYVSKDISHGGIFVDKCGQNFKPGDFVYLKFTAPLSKPPEECLIKAMAVHQSGGGTGFMWAGSNQAFHRGLDQIRRQGTAS